MPPASCAKQLSSGCAGGDETLQTMSSLEHRELERVILGGQPALVQDGPDDLGDETRRDPALNLGRQRRGHFSRQLLGVARRVACPQRAGTGRGAMAAVLNQGSWRGR